MYLEGECPWFVMRLEQTRSITTLMADTANTLLKRRIVTYQDTISEANVLKIEPLDNMIKDAFRENGGVTAQTGSYTVGAPDTVRSWQTYISVQANTGSWNAGASHRRRITHDLLLDVATVCAAKAADNPPAGISYFFDIVQIQNDGITNPFLELRTYSGQRGADRRSTVILSEAEKTLTDSKLTLDWADSVTILYAGGPGQAAARVFAKAQDPALPAILTTNPFYVRERFYDGRKAKDATETQGSANDQFSKPEIKPVREFSAAVAESACYRYGLDYFHGDRITAHDFGQSFSVFVNTVHVHVENNHETIEIKISDKVNTSASGLTGMLKSIKLLERSVRDLSSIDVP